jgi:hypothetical protein
MACHVPTVDGAGKVFEKILGGTSIQPSSQLEREPIRGEHVDVVMAGRFVAENRKRLSLTNKENDPSDSAS